MNSKETNSANETTLSQITKLFDDGSFLEIDRLVRDGENPAQVITGYGLVNGNPAYIFAQNHEECSGAIGKVAAKKICKIYDLAAQNGNPVIGIFNSDGVKLDEGVSSMEGLSAILSKSSRISGVVPQIALILGACVGSTAIVANNSDITVKVADADFYLNPGVENAEADIVVEDENQAFDKLKLVLDMLPSNNIDFLGNQNIDDISNASFSDVAAGVSALADFDEVVKLGCGENITAFARIGGAVCGIVGIAQDKVSEKEASKIARFVRLCDSFSVPVVTLIDCGGFATLSGASKVSHAYVEAGTVKVTLIVGKAYGSAYIALASEMTGADVVYALPTATVLPFSPETGVHIFWQDKLKEMKNPVEDRAKLAEAFATTEGDIFNVAGCGFVTDVIETSEVKANIVAALKMLEGKRVTKLPKKHSNIRL